MSTPAPHHSRAHKGKPRPVWRYTVHYSPVSPRLQFGVSKGGKVVHRAPNITAAAAWALDRTQDFYARFQGVDHPAVAEAAAALRQHGRIQ